MPPPLNSHPEQCKTLALRRNSMHFPLGTYLLRDKVYRSFLLIFSALKVDLIAKSVTAAKVARYLF